MIPDTFPDIHKIIYTLDLTGTAVCAIAASLLAKRLKFDPPGAFVIAMLGSVGGGTMRDLLINRHPIFWLRDLNYLLLITLACVITLVFYYRVEKVGKALRWFDAAGLAVFTVIGIEAAFSRGMSAPIAVCMGAITGAGGGVLRDIVCRQIPLVLQKEIYITASVAGSLYYIALMHTELHVWIRSLSTIALIVALRMLAVYRQWNFPNITLPEPAKRK